MRLDKWHRSHCRDGVRKREKRSQPNESCNFHAAYYSMYSVAEGSEKNKCRRCGPHCILIRTDELLPVSVAQVRTCSPRPSTTAKGLVPCDSPAAVPGGVTEYRATGIGVRPLVRPFGHRPDGGESGKSCNGPCRQYRHRYNHTLLHYVCYSYSFDTPISYAKTAKHPFLLFFA